MSSKADKRGHEPTPSLRRVPPHTPGAGYTCRACEKPHIPGCIRDRDASFACPNAVAESGPRDADAAGRLEDRVTTVLHTFRACVRDDGVNGELAEWFRPAFLIDAAKEIDTLLSEWRSDRARLRDSQERERALTQERDAVRAQLDAIAFVAEDFSTIAHEDLPEAVSIMGAIIREAEALRRDAARLDWLEENVVVDAHDAVIDGERKVRWDGETFVFRHRRGLALRKAIDAASSSVPSPEKPRND